MSKDQPQEESHEMSFLEHLETLRWHLIRPLIALSLLMLVLFNFKKIVFDVIIFGPTRIDFFTYEMMCRASHFVADILPFIDQQAFCVESINFNLISTNLSGQFMMHVWTTIIGSFVLAFPYFALEIWRFVRPALYKEETKGVRGIVFWVSLLFFVGVLFGYFIVAPISIQFLSQYSIGDVENQIKINSYVSTITTLVLSSGLIFQLPVVIYFLTKAGILSAALLRAYQKHAFVVVLILSAVITPPDISSMILLSFPLWILYILSIFIARRQERKAARQDES